MRGGIGYDRDKIREAATIIVAASDSLHPERADYVCPAADALDYITTTVLPTLPAGGGAIMLLEGTYNVSTNTTPLLINAQNNVTIRGQGKGTHLQLSNGIQSNIIQVQDSTGILIADLYCDGTTTAADAGAVTNQNSIYFSNVDESKIRGLWCENNKRHGILLFNGSNLNEVTGCSSHSNTQQGIYLGTSSNNTVTGNTCNGNTKQGINLDTSPNNTVTGNICQGNTERGIYLGTSSNNTVTGNICQGNTERGIYLGTSSNNTVTGNICQGSTWDGIFLEDAQNNMIISNTCQSNGRRGIRLDVSSNNTITGNMCIDNDSGDTNTYDGIYIDVESNYNLIEGNKCYITTPGARQRYGIRINSADCNGNLVIDNDLLQGGRTGNFSDAGTGTIYFSPEQNIAMDLLAEDTNHVVAAHDLTVGPGPCAIAAQIDKPRNITITITDANASISAFQIDVVGINTKGEADTEQFVFAGGLVQVGNVAWAHITSITVTSITGAGALDVLDVGIGSKLGITGSLYIAADVYHVVKNTVDWPAANYTVDLTHDTVDISTGGAINAGDDATIFFRASRNRIK